MKIRLLAEALVEYEEAFEYYERVEAGIGDRFLAEVDDAFALLLEFPQAGAPVEMGALQMRRWIVETFDVEINYAPHDGDLVVIAIFHCRREPTYWRDRVSRMRR